MIGDLPFVSWDGWVLSHPQWILPRINGRDLDTHRRGYEQCLSPAKYRDTRTALVGVVLIKTQALYMAILESFIYIYKVNHE